MIGALTAQEEKLISDRFDDLLANCVTRIKGDEDRTLIIEAFELANEAHKEMKRKSGGALYSSPDSCCQNRCKRNRTWYHLGCGIITT